MAVKLSLFAGAGWQFFDNSGNPLTGGLLYTYLAGTTTPAATYTSLSGLTANPNPIIFDAAGRPPSEIWLTEGVTYKFVLKTPTFVEIGTWDNIPGANDVSAATNILINDFKAQLANTTNPAQGDALVGFRQSNSSGNLTNATARTVHQKLQETISVKDFGAVGNGIADDTDAIFNAVNQTAGKKLYFPSGTYVVSSPIRLNPNNYLTGDYQNSVLFLKSGSYAADNKSIFYTTNTTSIEMNVVLENLVFDGNKGNVGVNRNPMNTFFRGSNYLVKNCIFKNCEGIALNISNITSTVYVEGCSFIDCGGKPDNSDGYRNQAIAFSNDTVSDRTSNVHITNNFFSNQGLDCISINNCDNVVVANNIAEDSYAFLYNNPTPAYSTNVTVVGNSIYNTNQGSYVTVTPPLAIDLPSVINSSVIGNVINVVAAGGIGVFVDSNNVVIADNTILNCGKNSVSWLGAINLGTSGATTGGPSNIKNVVISNNTILDTQATSTLYFGILIQNDVKNTYIANNNIQNWLTSKYGYFNTPNNPSVSTTFALTNNTPIDATVLIKDLDVVNGVETNWRKINTLTSYNVNGIQVVGAQQAAIPNSGDATVNAILAALRTHGLIAT